MFTVEITEYYCDTFTPGQRYGKGTGYAMHRSPKRAVELAWERLSRDAGEAGGWTPIMGSFRMRKNGKWLTGRDGSI